MDSKIKDLALNAIVENPASEAWVFTDSELHTFAESIINECTGIAWCNFHANGSAIYTLIHEHFGLKNFTPSDYDTEDIVYRLQKRAEIRRQIPGRKSVLEGKPDRISDLLEEAAVTITSLRTNLANSRTIS